MEIGIREEGGVPVAAIAGEIDGKTAPQAQAQLMPVIERAGRVLMDMTGVSYMSSAGLRILLLLYRQATARDGKVVLVGLTDQIRDTMAMTGFLKYFMVCGSVEEGLEALGS